MSVPRIDRLRLLRQLERPPRVAIEINRTRLLNALQNEELSKVVLWRIEDFSNQEFAGLANCSLKTVGRRLRMIRSLAERGVTMSDSAFLSSEHLSLEQEPLVDLLRCKKMSTRNRSLIESCDDAIRRKLS